MNEGYNPILVAQDPSTNLLSPELPAGGDMPASIPTAPSDARSVLMIAFHYPPCRGSSGLQRTLSFSRYLGEYGWRPIVLSANPSAYVDQGTDQLSDIPASVPVLRTFALDSARHLSVRGRYLSWTSLPDRWVSWCVGAIPNGLRLIRRYRPDVIWSTYPIATAHLIGMALHRLTGIPWVADFRDPMTEVDAQTGQHHPGDPQLWRTRHWIESHTIKACSRAVVVTAGSLRIHAERYPYLSSSHWAVVANGYDEQIFPTTRKDAPSTARSRALVLLHSGVLYPTPDRDPTALFTAVRMLLSQGRISRADVKIVLRASGHEERYRKQIQELGIADIVFLEPPITYSAALTEMLSADGLLLFQGYTSNPAIPAKLYEYLRAKRPILAMVDANGDTAGVLRKARVGRIVPLEFSDKIAATLLEFLEGLRNGSEPVANDAEIRLHSRQSKAAELASVLNSVVRAPAKPARSRGQQC
jgi:hypothetical protein